MVAASRLARAQRSMQDAKAYGAANNAVFEQSEASKSEAKVEKILYIVASSDRGLCGGIHSSVAKAARKDILEGEGAGKEIRVIALGEKPKQQMSRGDGAKDIELSFSQIGKSVPTFNDALAIADKIEAEKFDFDKVRCARRPPAPRRASAHVPPLAGQDHLQQVRLGHLVRGRRARDLLDQGAPGLARVRRVRGRGRRARRRPLVVRARQRDLRWSRRGLRR